MAVPDAVSVVDLLTHGPRRFETGRKQVTLVLGGLYIASTTVSAKPKLVWETEKGYGRYYIPVEALQGEIRSQLNGFPFTNDHQAQKVSLKIEKIETVNGRGNDSKAVIEKLIVGEKRTTWVRFLEGPFKNFIRFERHEIGKSYLWDTDDWFENGAIFVAIKNPYKRIDTTAVSRHILVKVDGEVVAESNVAVLLNETGQLESYYIPATSIKNWGVVERSELRTVCPYKGEALYFSVNVKGKKYENLIWYYQYPTHESAAVEGLISFYRKPGVETLVEGVKI